jgi:hypothetical protein
MSIFRSRAFLIGLGLGIVGSGALAVQLVNLINANDSGLSVLIEVAGDEASQHGTARIVALKVSDPVFDKRCRGRCDDIRVGGASSDSSLSIRMLDLKGACLTCTPGGYVTNGITSKFSVGGIERPTVSMTYQLDPVN